MSSIGERMRSVTGDPASKEASGGDQPRQQAPDATDRSPERLADERQGGAWSMRFGRFGHPDNETHGGIVQVFGDRFIGGDRNFAYRGRWQVEGSRLIVSIEMMHHGFDPSLLSILGTEKDEYVADCIAEPVGPGRFEGRIRRAGHPDVRVVLRQLSFDRHDEAMLPGTPRHFHPIERETPPPPSLSVQDNKYPGWLRLLILCGSSALLWAMIATIAMSLG